MAKRSWGNDPFASGAFPEIAPGQVQQNVEWAGKMLGQIYFAGNDTGIDLPAMEGALVTAERAAGAIGTIRHGA